MTTTPCRYVYRVNATNEITFVSPEWLEFAIENGALSLTQSKVVGTSIWRFVTGDSTRRLYEELFRRLRVHRAELAIPFNCDSPTVVRDMTLTLRALGAGSIELEGRLNSTRERQPISLLDPYIERMAGTVSICSLCRKVQLASDWISVEEAVVRKRWLTSTPLPQLDEALCPICEALAVQSTS